MDVDALNSHPSVTVLTHGISVISELPEDAKSVQAVADLLSRLEYLSWVFEQSDPALIVKSELASLAPTAQQLRSNLDSLPTNPKGHANGTEPQLDIYFSKFPIRASRKSPGQNLSAL